MCSIAPGALFWQIGAEGSHKSWETSIAVPPQGVPISSGQNSYPRELPPNGEPKMIRSELLQAIAADNPGLRLEEVEEVVGIFFEEISARLAKGGRVELRGFGTYSTRARESRTGRNPRTGEPVEVAAKRVPYFKPGKEMRERLNADAE